MKRVKTLALRGAAAGEDRLAGAAHVRRLDVVADHLEGEIGLHRAAHVERPLVDEGPAAMLRLACGAGSCRSWLEALGGLACRGTGGTGRTRTGSWRRPRARSRYARRRGPGRSARGSPARRRAPRRRGRSPGSSGAAAPRPCSQPLASSSPHRTFGPPDRGSRLAMPHSRATAHRAPIPRVVPMPARGRPHRRRASAAVLPERIAPSIVEGRPVAVQSPARTRFA